MTHEYASVTTSVGDEAAAVRLARALIEQRLAACVQISAIRSIYRWNDKIEDSAEHLLVCKIRTADFSAGADAIRRLHGYEVPEILMSPILEGHEPYLTWIGDCVARTTNSNENGGAPKAPP